MVDESWGDQAHILAGRHHNDEVKGSREERALEDTCHRDGPSVLDARAYKSFDINHVAFTVDTHFQNVLNCSDGCLVYGVVPKIGRVGAFKA